MIYELQNSTYKVVKEIKKGWSHDKKYYIETVDNQKLLMRIADAKLYNNKKIEFEMMQRFYALGVPMSKPIDFGICKDNEHVYILHSWIDGDDLQDVLSTFSIREQYSIGFEAGQILKKLHSIKAPSDCEEWWSRSNRKINKKIETYNSCPIKIADDKYILDFIENNRHLLDNRPQRYHHGDYHIGNMILSKDKKLSIIDFNRCDFGDPWEEFNRIVFCASASPAFASGRVNGYFDKEVPNDFFKLIALYQCTNTISSVPWAIPYGQKDVQVMLDNAQRILRWYNNMNDFVPSWYKGFYSPIT